tara:strand:- start:41199 stop:41810 length:612 start_codon:yes stop_codon:yes gene_type:complete
MALSILAQFGLPVLVEMAGGVLRSIAHPSAQSAADALEGLEDAIKSGALSEAELREANRHVEEMTKIQTEQHNALSNAVNQTIRAEISAEDAYVRRMRPTFGYVMALSWAAQMFGVAYILIFKTSEAFIVINAIESLGTIWAVALSVLGIYVYKRSDDKKTMLPRLITPSDHRYDEQVSAAPTLPASATKKPPVNNAAASYNE